MSDPAQMTWRDIANQRAAEIGLLNYRIKCFERLLPVVRRTVAWDCSRKRLKAALVKFDREWSDK